MEKKKKSMKLRTRVIISFFIIILVPIVMCALTFYFFVGYKAKIIGEKYGLANATYRTISNNTLLLNAMTSEEYDEVEDTAKSDTAKLEETNYLSVLNARLQKKQSFIAVREDGVIIYNGSEELSSEELENELPKYGDPGANSKGGVYFRNEKQWMVKQVDYENVDGKECSAFIVTKTDQIAPQITGMVKELGIVIVLILVLTSLGLSFWIYRGVIGPLGQLKKATQNIKDGNLDFTVEPCGVAEINDLCEDFEEMRIRLKETAEGVAKAMGAQASVQFRPGYIAQKNDDRVMDLLMETAAECVGKEMIFQKPYPSMGVEDFAFYSAQRPSVFFFAGTGYPDRKNYGIHHGRFEADERALDTAVLLEVMMCLRLMRS